MPHFADAAKRVNKAGFDFVEIHCSSQLHLLHEFLSPLANQRTDQYGGRFRQSNPALAGGDRFGSGQRGPKHLPLFVHAFLRQTGPRVAGRRMKSVELARRLRRHGVDLVDVSSGGQVPNATIPVGPGFQVPFAERIRKDAGIPTAAVGMDHAASAGQ